MKVSLYTYLFEKNGICYLYNCENGFLTSIAKTIYEALYNGDFESLDHNIIVTLREKGVLIEEEHLYDFYYSSKLAFLSAIGIFDSLHLIIAPTTGCNFACPYCFEGEKANKRMTPDTVEDLIKFINGYKETKDLMITWYGGEPLTAYDIMKEIVKKIKAECRINLKYQSIVTNGYLLNNEIIEFMRQNNFKDIQITFDGMEINHNKTRYLKGNRKATFNRIWTNVCNMILSMPENFEIAIRVNVNRNNERDFVDMLKMVKEKFPQKNVTVYPGFIRESNKDNNMICYNCLFGRSRFDFYKQVESQGIAVDFFPRRVHKGCMTCRNNQLIIGPEGEIYKCWNDFNNPERIVGNIKDKKMSNPSLISRYAYEATIYNNPECKECKLFPICTGGCSWFRYQNVFNGKNYDVCSYLKDNSILEECLLKKVQRNGPFKIDAQLNV